MPKVYENIPVLKEIIYESSNLLPDSYALVNACYNSGHDPKVLPFRGIDKASELADEGHNVILYSWLPESVFSEMDKYRALRAKSNGNLNFVQLPDVGLPLDVKDFEGLF